MLTFDRVNFFLQILNIIPFMKAFLLTQVQKRNRYKESLRIDIKNEKIKMQHINYDKQLIPV